MTGSGRGALGALDRRGPGGRDASDPVPGGPVGLGLNRVVLRFSLTTVTPLRVSAGGPGAPWPEVRCARTRLAGQPSVYLPGAGLKGALRAVAARRLHCACAGSGGPARNVPPAGVADARCLVCRTFGRPDAEGEGGLRARLRVPDLLPVTPGQWGDALEEAARFAEAHAGTPGADLPLDLNGNEWARANAVAVDYAPGAPGAAPSAVETVPPWSSFFGEVVLHDFQAWQLGLVALGLRALDRGEARLGGARSQGRGRVAVKVLGLRFEQGLRAGNGVPCMLGELVSPAWAAAHDLLPEAPMPGSLGKPHGLYRRFELGAEAATAWLDAGLAALEHQP